MRKIEQQMIEAIKAKKNYSRKIPWIPVLLEGLMMTYFGWGLYLAFHMGDQGDFGLFAFHLMAAFGFGYLFFKSIFTP